MEQHNDAPSSPTPEAIIRLNRVPVSCKSARC